MAPEGGALLEAEVVQGSQLERLGQHQLPGGRLRGAVLAVRVQHVNHRLCCRLLSGCESAIRYLHTSIIVRFQLVSYGVRSPHLDSTQMQGHAALPAQAQGVCNGSRPANDARMQGYVTCMSLRNL